MRPEKISVAMVTNDMNINGISTVVMNYCKYLNKDKFNVTIIAGKPINELYVEECKKYGIALVEMPERREKPVLFYLGLFKCFIANRYDIVHVHGNSAMITPELFLAWTCGIKHRIAHSHNSTCDNMKAHRVLLPLFNKLYTDAFACRNLAGRWLFGARKFRVLNNGFLVEKFRFDNAKRQLLRKEYGLEDSFVIGDVARFNDQKNHPFLLNVFESVAEQKTNAKLVLIGTGPNLESVKEKIANSKYKDRILYLGESDKVNELYNLMDVFVLPSKHEGLGIVFIEAQINGLPVVTSDQVPREIDLGGKVVFLPLQNSPQSWADEILTIKKTNRLEYYDKHYKEIIRYNISDNVKTLEEYYQCMMRN